MILWAVLCAVSSVIFLDSLINKNEFNAIGLIAVICTLISFILKKWRLNAQLHNNRLQIDAAAPRN